MALTDIEDLETPKQDDSIVTDGSSGLNANAPQFAKDIVANKSKLPLDVGIGYAPNNPYDFVYPQGFLSSPSLEGIQEKPSFIDTAKAQAYRMNATVQGINALDTNLEQSDPTFFDKPDAWTSKTDTDKFVNVRPQYVKALLDAKSPKHQDQILQRIYQEQKADDDIANGSWLAWLVGGAAGIATDPMTYIPVAGWVKYGKISSSFLTSAAKALGGGATYGVLSSAAEQMDKVNGNMHDFVVDSFVKTAFASALFGGIGAAASLTEKMELWNLKNFAKAHVDGVDFKFKVNEKGHVDGFEMVDTTGALSAEKVSFYKNMADSSFYKSGIFKIPYVGEGIIKLAGMPVFGSPLINLINSKSMVMRAFIDRVADHNFITKAVAEGLTAPKKFASLMNQEFAKLRTLDTQYNALHLERNGFDIKSRLGVAATDLSLNIYNKGLKLLGQELDNAGYVSKEMFNDEVQQVIHSGESSQHAAVNEAAGLHREQMDTTYKAYRKAYNLPDDWMPPKTAEQFLTRVYDTPYMNANKGKWVSTVSNWLAEADTVISERMRPILDLEKRIDDFEQLHGAAIYELGLKDIRQTNEEMSTAIVPFVTEVGPGIKHKTVPIVNKENVIGIEGPQAIGSPSPSLQLSAMKSRLRAMKDQLQNELRTNPELQLHVEDWNSLSSDEGKELTGLLKPLNKIKEDIKTQEQFIRELKARRSKELSETKRTKTEEKAQPKAEKFVETDLELQNEITKLKELEDKHFIELDSLQAKAQNGEINSRFYKKIHETNLVEFKNPNERLKFRDVYESHNAREVHAKAYYDTILNQTPEDTINQVMGRFTGNTRENPLKSRTLLLPDQVLYDGKFLTNDLMAKVSNYTSYLARRTHLKTVFNDVTIDGGIEPIIAELGIEHNKLHDSLSKRKTELETKLENKDLDVKEKKQTEKNLKRVEKELDKSRKDFDKNKEIMNHIYDKMMGIQKTSRKAMQIKSAIMSITAWANLPFVPLTQINDLSAIALQHGFIPFIRDGLAPLVENLVTLGKGKDAEAFRKTAPSIHLALQDVNMGYADRNWGSQTNPYLNLGRTVDTLQKIAHLSSNFTGTNYIDNMLQRMTGSVVQSELMRIAHSWKAGTLSKRDGLYIRKYGIDLDKYGDRILDAFKKNGGGKTKLGGYQSHFWQWEDQEASNVFGDAIFRSIKDTQISAGLIDAPLFLDDNGPIGIMGSFLRGFNGWAFASVNRYVIPSLQQADGEKLIGVMAMLATGYLVDPMRRAARGEEMLPESLTAKQIAWATINNSGYFSWFANILSNANLISGDSLMGNLRSDKYKDRTRAGLLGPAWGTVNRMADIISALGSGEMNEADAKKMARMIPFANASWTSFMTKHFVESLGLPKNRREARAIKESGV